MDCQHANLTISISSSDGEQLEAAKVLDRALSALGEGRADEAAKLVYRRNDILELIRKKGKSGSKNERLLAFFAEKPSFATPKGWEDIHRKLKSIEGHRNGADMSVDDRLTMLEVRTVEGVYHNLVLRKFGEDGRARLEDNRELQAFCKKVADASSGEVGTFATCALLTIPVIPFLAGQFERDLDEKRLYLSVTSNDFLSKMKIEPWSRISFGGVGHVGFLNGKTKEQWDIYFDKVEKWKLDPKTLCQIEIPRLNLSALFPDKGPAADLLEKAFGKEPDLRRLVAEKMESVLWMVSTQTHGYRVSVFAVVVLFFIYLFNALLSFFGKPIFHTSHIGELYGVDERTGEVTYLGPQEEEMPTRLCYCSGFLLDCLLGTMQIMNSWIKWHIINSRIELSESERQMVTDPKSTFFKSLVPGGVYVAAVPPVQMIEYFEQARVLEHTPRPNLQRFVADYPDCEKKTPLPER
ncbi:MAG: hypothetical protein LBB14_00230 [Puniceicoccales bacterium]|jgi:hypothetical protein|nr:hypothetical protein [Puniceicoccales bacterium]